MKRANLQKEIKAESFAERTKSQKQYSDAYLQSVAAGLGFGKSPPRGVFLIVELDRAVILLEIYAHCWRIPEEGAEHRALTFLRIDLKMNQQETKTESLIT